LSRKSEKQKALPLIIWNWQ